MHLFAHAVYYALSSLFYQNNHCDTILLLQVILLHAVWKSGAKIHYRQMETFAGLCV